MTFRVRLLAVVTVAAGIVAAPLAQTRQPFSRVAVTVTPDRRKSAGLAADLRALGVAPEALPRCSDLPDLPGPAAVLGCAYVLEGATLGGQILSRHVAGCLGLSAETGGRFFHGYGERTGAMWKAFTSAVRGFVARHGQEDAIVNGAVDTFRSLRAWCG